MDENKADIFHRIGNRLQTIASNAEFATDALLPLPARERFKEISAAVTDIAIEVDKLRRL